MNGYVLIKLSYKLVTKNKLQNKIETLMFVTI